MNDEAVAKMLGLQDELVLAARAFADFMREHGSPQLAVALPLDESLSEWLAIGKPETICRLFPSG
jgi:hypothetical protein